MKVYTYSEARQRLASLLEQSQRGGEVRIRRPRRTNVCCAAGRRHGLPL